MSLFGKRKSHASADVIAEVFLSEFVDNNDLCPNLQMSLSEEQTEAYRSKCRLYRLALVLMAILGDEQSDPKVSEVRQSVEQRVFGVQDEYSEVLLRQVRAAMVDLRSLLFPEGQARELTWARSWLTTAGIDSSNAIVTAKLASNWMSLYITMVKSLREFHIT